MEVQRAAAAAAGAAHASAHHTISARSVRFTSDKQLACSASGQGPLSSLPFGSRTAHRPIARDGSVGHGLLHGRSREGERGADGRRRCVRRPPCSPAACPSRSRLAACDAWLVQSRPAVAVSWRNNPSTTAAPARSLASWVLGEPTLPPHPPSHCCAGPTLQQQLQQAGCRPQQVAHAKAALAQLRVDVRSTPPPPSGWAPPVSCPSRLQLTSSPARAGSGASFDPFAAPAADELPGCTPMCAPPCAPPAVQRKGSADDAAAAAQEGSPAAAVRPAALFADRVQSCPPEREGRRGRRPLVRLRCAGRPGPRMLTGARWPPYFPCAHPPHACASPNSHVLPAG